MNFFKKTIFWVIVLAVVGGSFYIFDKETEDEKAEVERQKRLFPFEPGDVTVFTITRKGVKAVEEGEEGEESAVEEGEKKEQSIRAERLEGGDWVVVSPVDAPGDGESIGTFLESVVGAKWDGVLFDEQTPEKLEEMSLEDPYLRVEFVTGGGNATVRFGEKGPTHNVAYALIDGDPRIFRIHSDIRADADKEVYDIRDKTIFSFDTTKVKSFKVVWTGGETIEVKHPAEGRWDTVGLPEGTTNFMRVMELLIKFKNSDIKAFDSEAPESLEPYALEKPRVKIFLIDEKGVRHSILIGARDKKRRGIFSMRGGEEAVFVIEEEVFDAVPRGVTDFKVEEKEGEDEEG
ncbi:MAG: DUF4340 domain-containing protein [Thermodesulfobacteriota bacterium]